MEVSTRVKAAVFLDVAVMGGLICFASAVAAIVLTTYLGVESARLNVIGALFGGILTYCLPSARQAAMAGKISLAGLAKPMMLKTGVAAWIILLVTLLLALPSAVIGLAILSLSALSLQLKFDVCENARLGIKQVGKLKTAGVLLGSLIAAEVGGRVLGFPLLGAAVMVALVIFAIYRAYRNTERAQAAMIDAAVNANSLKALLKLEAKLGSDTLPSQRNRLANAIKARSGAYAIALQMAAKAPAMRYYAEIFKQAAKNIISQNFNVSFKFKDLCWSEELRQTLSSEYEFVFSGKPEYFSSAIPSDLDEKERMNCRYFQDPSNWGLYDKGGKFLTTVLNSIVGEDLFKEGSGDLKISVVRGTFSHIPYNSTDIDSCGIYILKRPALIKVSLDKATNNLQSYRFVHYGLFSTSHSLNDLVSWDTYITYGLEQKIALDWALFLHDTLGIPFDKLIAKTNTSGAFQLSVVIAKLSEIVKDEVKGQIQDAVIENLADKFFREHGEMVAELLGECLKDRAASDLGSIIADVLVGSAIDAALELAGEALVDF